MKNKLLYFILIFYITFANGQTELDSLYNIWKDKTQLDSIRGKAYNKYIWKGYLFRKPDSAEILSQRLLDFTKEKNIPYLESSAYDIIGISHNIRGNNLKALEYFNKGLEVSENNNNKKGIATSYNNIGIVYKNLGDYDKAIENYQKSIKFFELVKDKKRVGSILFNIGVIYGKTGKYIKALEHYKQSLKIKLETKGDKSTSGVLSSIGQIYQMQGSYPKALEYYKRALKINEVFEDKNIMAHTYNNIGILYRLQKNYIQAEKYNQLSIGIYEEIMDKKGISRCLLNFGVINKNQGNLSISLDYYKQSLELNTEMKDKSGISLSFSSIGLIEKELGNYSSALNNYSESLRISRELGDRLGEASAYNYIGSVYHSQGRYLESIEEYKNALKLSRQINSLSLTKNIYFNLYKSYKAIGNGDNALKYHEQMLVLNDSLKKEETAKKLQQMEFSKQVLADSLVQVEKDLKVKMAHQNEVRKKDNNKNIALGAGIFFLFLSSGFYSRWRYVKKSKAVIEKEKDRSENLLLNILPSEIAEELKAKGSTDARDFDMVSILFTDFKGFTQVSEKLSSKDLIEELNVCFKAFDRICETYGIEKIKTIGDAYMAAGGLPVPSENSIRNTVLAALDMQAFISNRIIEKNKLDALSFKMRLGIHTGPVVAGIVGVKKFQYDIWGDTVNTASRIESSGEIGKVNISEDTYLLLKNNPEFVFESRGKIQAKGKGEIEMYFVEQNSKLRENGIKQSL